MKKMLIFLMAIVMSLGMLVGCGKKETIKPISKTNLLLGTVVNIKIYDKVEDGIFEQIFDRLSEIESEMSVKIDTSEVSMINKNAGIKKVKVSDDTMKVINVGKEYSKLSEGNFDISILPIVRLWNIGTDKARVPSQEEIEAKKPLVNFKNIEIYKDTNEVMLLKKGMALDLGGIAKGYAADEIVKILEKENVKAAVIDLGGNITVYGSKEGQDKWKIGLQNPYKERNKHLGVLNVKDESIVTSGIYERKFEKDGKLYHHILSPFNGYPVDNDLASVTIVTKESINADSLSTATFSLGLNKGLEFLESMDGVEGIFVTKEKKVYITEGLKDTFVLSDKDFEYVK